MPLFLAHDVAAAFLQPARCFLAAEASRTRPQPVEDRRDLTRGGFQQQRGNVDGAAGAVQEVGQPPGESGAGRQRHG